jgi:hypothetical protein
MKKRSLKHPIKVSRFQVYATIGLLLTAGLFLIRLGSLPAHMSDQELQTYQNNLHLHNIVHNPLNAPYNLIDYVLLHILGHTVEIARLTSVLFALLASFLFFITMLRWHGKRTAWLATILFVTSGWLLHLARLGAADILWLVIPLVLILIGSWLTNTDKHNTAIIVVAAILGLMLFIPAGVWFVAVFLLLLGKLVIKHFRSANALPRSIAVILLLLLAAAIGFSLFRSHDLIREWAGIPQMMPKPLSAAKVWISSIVLYPFVRGPLIPEIWLGHTPILDIFTTIMCLLGAYFYLTHFRNLRARMLTALVVVGSVLTALNGPTAMSFIVPVAYLIAATGITYLLHEWLTVFPRNPVARFAGITLITLAITCAATYHLISYFVAWQHNPQAVATFQRKP